MFNASVEIAKADKYPSIRLFTNKLIASEVPKEESMGILQPWQVASAGDTQLYHAVATIMVVSLLNSTAAVNGSAWQYFSATCWFFAINLYDSVKVPLGMVATSWGGTRIEAWSSPDALKKCPMSDDDMLETRKERCVHPCQNNKNIKTIY